MGVQAERVAGGVGENVQRFLGVVGAMSAQDGAEVLRALGLGIEPIGVVDVEAEVHLHGDLWRRPGGLTEILGALERQQPLALGGAEHQPVRVVAAVRGWLVSVAVDEAEQEPVELRGATDVGRVDDDGAASARM